MHRKCRWANKVELTAAHWLLDPPPHPLFPPPPTLQAAAEGFGINVLLCFEAQQSLQMLFPMSAHVGNNGRITTECGWSSRVRQLIYAYAPRGCVARQLYAQTRRHADTQPESNRPPLIGC